MSDPDLNRGASVRQGPELCKNIQHGFYLRFSILKILGDVSKTEYIDINIESDKFINCGEDSMQFFPSQVPLMF